VSRYSPILRCIWHKHPKHRKPANLDLDHVGDREVLVCRGCPAIYLTKDGIPRLLEESLLTPAERRELKLARKALERRRARNRSKRCTRKHYA
jgi:uncharacterized protein YbaR (Trm112 family)